MTQFELKKVTTDTSRVYSPNDKFVFNLTFNNKSEINDDVEFEITYFGDAYSDNHDQRICHNVIGPLQEGMLSFDLETTPIDLTKIPIKTLFGLTTILIIGKFKSEQFIRIGYVVNVEYPGVETEKLQDSDDKPIEEEDMEDVEDAEDEEGSGEESDIEIMDDEELENDEESANEEGSDDEPCCSNENCDNPECGVEQEDENSQEEEEPCCSDENCDNSQCGIEEEYCCSNENCDDPQCGVENSLEKALASVLMPKNTRKPIPLETPIVAGVDDFVYKDIQMKQSLIKLTLLENPIVHVFDIDWTKGENPEGENFKESSESNYESEEEQTLKKSKKN